MNCSQGNGQVVLFAWSGLSTPLRQTQQRNRCIVTCKAARRGRKGGGGRSQKGRAAKPKLSERAVKKANAKESEEGVEEETNGVEAKAEAIVEEEVEEESRVAPLQLPDLPTSARGARRRRRRKQSEAVPEVAKSASDSEVEEEAKALPMSEIERLTAAYRAGGEKARELVSKIEVEPNFMFRDGQAEGEYELASAIIGTGKRNKQGVYVLPYLQSSHMMLLAVILLGTFVYYPGFPLTEGSDELRGWCKLGLGVTYTVNLGLAVYSYSEAKRRKQPALFWFFKVALLGNIALQELKSNAPLDKKTSKVAKKKGGTRKQK